MIYCSTPSLLFTDFSLMCDSSRDRVILQAFASLPAAAVVCYEDFSADAAAAAAVCASDLRIFFLRSAHLPPLLLLCCVRVISSCCSSSRAAAKVSGLGIGVSSFYIIIGRQAVGYFSFSFICYCLPACTQFRGFFIFFRQHERQSGDGQS